MSNALTLGSALYGLLCYRYFYGRWPVWIFNNVESAVREWRPVVTRLREEMMRHTLNPMTRTRIERNIIRKSGVTPRVDIDVKQAEKNHHEARCAFAARRPHREVVTHYIEEQAIPVFATPGGVSATDVEAAINELTDDPFRETDSISLPPDYYK